ncbi:SURF1 family protein [Phaeobacter sp. J2-8]|uniref:SURF1 family protein n=1 Tax=Phaeobacter sp. J2-8 TaxID=2931394 RepID=UPI001FD3595D|nr:SURF1 family protein [Phaeobacter sp. J2-8]MCJ7873041.1 SURF1 family protein [Phaeobacter sp. J2-8]
MQRILFALIVGLAGTAILVGLGLWQLQRLDWKQGVLAAIEDRISATPVALPAHPDPVTDKYLPVALEGRFDSGEIHVLVSQKHVGAGYRVIAPFVLEDGRRILVDRGFVPVVAVDDARPIGPARVIGNLHWPDDRNSSTPDNDLAGNIWFARDIVDMAAALDTTQALVIARTSEPEDPAITPLPVDTASIPNDHLQYVITWFSLAAIWLGMTGFYIYRATRNKDA